MLIEPSSEDELSVLPPVYRVEIQADDSSSANLLETLDRIESPLGAIPEQKVRLASVLENTKLTSEGHF